MADPSPRLALALDKGLLELPDDGPILLVNPAGNVELGTMPTDRMHAVQPMWPDHDALVRRGLDTRPDMPETGRFAAGVVYLPRSKDQARGLIAAACALTQGLLIVDGAKTDGIDSLMKDLRERVPLEGVYSKAHGKLFWFVPDGGKLEDWRQTSRIADGFLTQPGLFSADSVDPASALLAGHLPPKLGRHVVDMGAGWGYLSARVLETSQPARVDLVEADHAALDCARQNVTDPRAQFFWADARTWSPDKAPDAVVMNPPFHKGRAGDPGLGQAFINNAARILAPHGCLWMVANRHLPYEAALAAAFAKVDEIGSDGRFKIFRAERPSRRRP